MVTRETPEQLRPREADLIRQHLQDALRSRAFAGSRRAQEFLTLLVEHALAGRFDSLHERAIGAEMFGRPLDYDTATDSVVRVKATEVRKKLARFYAEAEPEPDVHIELPSGTYIPRFVFPGAVLQDTSVEGDTDPDRVTPSTVQTSAGPSVAAVNTPRRRAWIPLPLSRSWKIALLGIFLLAVLVAGVRKWRNDAAADAESRSIVILPLENLSGDPAQDYFADGITEELIADLGRVTGLHTISRTSAMSYKRTQKKLPEIARELSVKWVVEGSVLREGNQVRLTVKLIDAGTDHTVWSNTYLRDITNILRLQGELAQAIADNISVEVTPQTRARFAQVRPVKREAEDLYLQGMLYLNTSQVERSLEFFQRAIEVDPEFAQPHAALAKAYGWMGESGRLAYSAAFSRQKSEATRAIELDDTLAEGHAELASAAMELNWDWAQAEREFRRALELNPGSVSVRMGYATYLMKTGNTSAAIAEVERCMKLDPLSEGLFQQAETIYFFSRKYDQTLAVHNQALARNFSTSHFVLGLVYRERGLYDKAIAEFRSAAASPHILGHLGSTYARAGQTMAANKVIEQLEDHIQRDAIGSYEIALIYAGLGNKEKAFDWLEKSLAQKDKGLVYLKVDPCLDPLRSDPRFNNLVQRVGLPL